MSRRPNWSDALGQDIAYVVLRKENRVQVGFHPSPKQLRRWGKRDWLLVAAIPATPHKNDLGGLPEELRQAVLEELRKFTAVKNGSAEGTDKKKGGKKARRTTRPPGEETL